MNWKEFLKPDLRKIVLTFVFISIAIYFASIIAPIEGIGKILAFIFLFPIYVDVRLLSLGSVTLIVEVFWLYVLSCLIIWIYDKMKKR